MTTSNVYELDRFKVEIRQVAGIWHINAISRLNTAHSPEVNAYCLIGENGELLVAPYEFYATMVGTTVVGARSAINGSISEESLVSFSYGERPDGGPDGRLRRTYTEVQCLRAAIKGCRKADGFKGLCCAFLDELKALAKKLDSGVDWFQEGSLRTPYSLAAAARKPRRCAGETEASAVDAIVKEPIADTSVAEEAVIPDTATEESVSAPAAGKAVEETVIPDHSGESEEFDTMSIVSEMLSKGRERNELMIALADLIRAERRTDIPAADKLREVAKAFRSVKAAATAFGKEA